MDTARRRQVAADWEERRQWPLLLAAVLFLAAYAGLVLDRQLNPWLRDLCGGVLTLTWLVFLGDYLLRLALAEQRGRWFLRHLFDLVILVLPLFRPLQVLRVVTLIKVLNRSAATRLRGQVTAYVLLGSLLLAFVGALAEYDAERAAPHATITGFGDALWWAFTTMSTVGYGDFSPVTFMGRVVAVLMMFAGVSVLGAVTATFASWLVERVQVELNDDLQDDLGDDIDREVAEEVARTNAGLRAELAGVREELRALRGEIGEIGEISGRGRG